MPLKDYYAILEISRDATLEQIKQSYRRLARRYHPDLNKHIHDDRIKQLNEAYDVLSDTVRRLHYDIAMLEQMRNALILDMIRRQQEQARREPKMTWREGVVGFVREMKKEMQGN
jgi:curved DNA-binding protein CbpA